MNTSFIEVEVVKFEFTYEEEIINLNVDEYSNFNRIEASPRIKEELESYFKDRRLLTWEWQSEFSTSSTRYTTVYLYK